MGATRAERAERAKPAKRAPRRTPATRGGAGDAGVREALADLALLTSANNLMAQTAFLTVERLRISSEVVDEGITQEFGNELYQACERLVEQSDALVLGVLDRLVLDGPRADLVRSLVGLRRQFKDHTRKPMEQVRLVESLERMYR